MNEIFTIGHSSYTQEQYLKFLIRYEINCIVDVRSMPYSKYVPQFNKEEIKKFLNSNAIYYIFMGKELGARREDKALYTNEGYLDFEKTSKTIPFINGIERVKTGIEKGNKIALMCMEKDPIDCHRNILVARQFFNQGFKVLNILENGLTETQEQLENRLLDLYFPERNQLTILDIIDKNTTVEKESLINQAYSLRNKEIGYSLDKEKERTQNEIIYNRVY
jgi:uncharacterized protein (DUF488 family)